VPDVPFRSVRSLSPFSEFTGNQPFRSSFAFPTFRRLPFL